MAIFLNKLDQDIVVFHVFKSLNYRIRLFISLALILAGLAIQYQMFTAFPGILIVFAGNLLLLVKGYDNRVKRGKYNHHTKWDKVGYEKLDQMEGMHKKMKDWDRSTVDITSGIGFLFFLVLIVTVIYFYIRGLVYYSNPYSLLASNLLVLLLPFWFTGAKKILTKPTLLLKIRLIKQVVYAFNEHLKNHQVEYYMLLKGKDENVLPEDVKFRVVFAGQNSDFLGLYAQITTNDVSGTKYPYFYVVLVAKEGFGLKQKTGNYTPPRPLIKEYTYQKDVEVMVIRQYTTRTSGYHTKGKVVSAIFGEGLKVANSINIVKND